MPYNRSWRFYIVTSTMSDFHAHFRDDIYAFQEESLFDDSPYDPNVLTQQDPGIVEDDQGREESLLRQKDIYQRCSDILGLLALRERRWSEEPGENSSIPLLEPYRRQILTEIDKHESEHPSLLHALARGWKKYQTDLPILRKAIIHIIEGVPKDGKKEAPIWSIAAASDNLAFLKFVQENCPAQLADILAMRNDNGQNFLHYIFLLAIDERTDRRRRETLDRAKEYVPGASESILAAQDKYGNTPIHYAMHPRQCIGRGAEYIKLVKKMVDMADGLMKRGADFNKQGQSPYQYCYARTAQPQETKSTPITQNEAQPKSVAEEKGKSPASPAVANVKARLGSNRAQPMQPPRTPADRGRSRVLEGSLQGSRPPSTEPHLSSTSVSAAAAAGEGGVVGPRRTPTFPSALTEFQQPGSTANALNRPRQEKDQGVKKRQGQSQNIEASKNHLLRHLQLHYLRERADVTARELIYGKHATERNLFFDAIGQQRKTADDIVTLISRLRDGGGFGDILSYVRIPVTTQIRAPQPQSPNQERKTYGKHQGSAKNNQSSEENPHPGRQCLTRVFDSLYDAGVRTIIRLEVNDMETPHHTDAAIERAITGADSLGLETPRNGGPNPIMIETWDWQRPDLSIDVIRQAAPQVEHLILYWSGNQTILRGWASEEGIPRLCIPADKSALRVVTIRAAPGLESSTRMKRSLATFRSSLEKRIQGKTLTIKEDFRIKGLWPQPSSRVGNSGYNDGGVALEAANRDRWMDTMDEFRGALYQVHERLPKTNPPVEKVRVALIDDGVALDSLSVYFEDKTVEVSGLSYYPRGEYTEEPWHHSTHGHGTVMANMIARINPWVSLCVMRIHDKYSRDSSLSIDPRSAAQAIRAAIGRKVNIISMSWTILARSKTSEPDLTTPITKPSMESSDLDDLRNAIGEAVKQKILIFCSANDDISADVKDFLPYQKDPEYIFRIGAAGKDGQRDPVSEDDKRMNFYFPGRKVAELEDPTSKRDFKYYTGASVSTALAAGLASLIIYCATLAQAYYESKGEATKRLAEEFARKREGLKQRGNIEKAFQSLTFPGWTHDKFPPVWGTFGAAATAIKESQTEKDMMDALTNLVHSLSSSIR
ncbi:hypothetical protein BDW75DRAFT_249236 [Aspergillus navahoensis]